jgi:hypothetical protein
MNLGLGASFESANTLKDRAVPRVFVTDYDAEAIPADFNDVVCVQKRGVAGRSSARARRRGSSA